MVHTPRDLHDSQASHWCCVTLLNSWRSGRFWARFRCLRSLEMLVVVLRHILQDLELGRTVWILRAAAALQIHRVCVACRPGAAVDRCVPPFHEDGVEVSQIKRRKCIAWLNTQENQRCSPVLAILEWRSQVHPIFFRTPPKALLYHPHPPTKKCGAKVLFCCPQAQERIPFRNHCSEN